MLAPAMKPSTSLRKDTCGAVQLGHQGWVQACATCPEKPTGEQLVASVDRAGQLHVTRVGGASDIERVALFNDGPELGQLTSVCWNGSDHVIFGSASVSHWGSFNWGSRFDAMRGSWALARRDSFMF